MGTRIGGNEPSPLSLSSNLSRIDQSAKKLSEGKQNVIIQILNKTQLGRNLVQKHNWEKFDNKDLDTKKEIESVTTELKKVAQKIQEKKEAIRPELTALHKKIEDQKAKLAKATDAFNKTDPKSLEKHTSLREAKDSQEASLQELKEQKKDLRKTEIRALTDLRQEWGEIKGKLDKINDQLKPTRLHNSSVAGNLKATQQKVNNEFEDFVSNFPGHHAYKANRLEEKIISNLKQIETRGQLNEISVGVTFDKEKVLNDTKEYLTKLHVLNFKVTMSGETETSNQIDKIIKRLATNFPEFQEIQEQAKLDSVGKIGEKYKGKESGLQHSFSTNYDVTPETLHDVDVKKDGEVAVAKTCDKAENDPFFKNGIYNEDSGVVGQFSDGTGYVVVGDGVGSTQGNSVYWTHVLCEEVGKSLQIAHDRLMFDPLDKAFTHGVLQNALAEGYDNAVRKMGDVPKNLSPPFDPKKPASSALSFSISCKIPGTEEKMIFGMNCADASIAIWEPKKGFTQMESSEKAGFVHFSPTIRTWEAQNRNFNTNIFQFRASNDAKMVGFSDGVSDCFYVDPKGKSEQEVKQETLTLMNKVVHNPDFDEEITKPLPPLESISKDQIAHGAIETPPDSEQIVQRLLNHSKWKTSENAQKNEVMGRIVQGEKNQEISQRIQVSFQQGQQISSSLWEILSDGTKPFFKKDDTGNYEAISRASDYLIAMKRSYWQEKLSDTHEELGFPCGFEDLTEDDRNNAAEIVKKMTNPTGENLTEEDKNPTALDNYVLLSTTRADEKYIYLRKKDSEGRLLEAGRKVDDVVVAVAP